MVSVKFLSGLLLLLLGAEFLVRGASRLAASVGLSSLVIGLTVVAFGTSAPEFAVSVKSALDGRSAVALGNVVGSNTFNVLFILGLAAIITPLAVSTQLVRLDVPIMIAASFGSIWLASDGCIGRGDGMLLFGGLMVYTAFLLVLGKRLGSNPIPNEPGSAGGGWVRSSALICVSLAMLTAGAQWFVEGAVAFAFSLGISELIVGLTIVAAGTSLPEIVTSVVASLRGERDIAVGNIVGSNIFNLLGVLGLTGLVAPGGVPVSPSVIHFDLVVMTAVAIVCLPIMFTGMSIARWEGALLLGYYGAYTIYLVLAATRHDALQAFSMTMMLFVIPLTACTLTMLGIKAWTKNQ
jgi:cation:H+ antiporter